MVKPLLLTTVFYHLQMVLILTNTQDSVSFYQSIKQNTPRMLNHNYFCKSKDLPGNLIFITGASAFPPSVTSAGVTDGKACRASFEMTWQTGSNQGFSHRPCPQVASLSSQFCCWVTLVGWVKSTIVEFLPDSSHLLGNCSFLLPLSTCKDRISKVTQFLLTLSHWDLSYLIPFQLVLLTKITCNSGVEADTRQASADARWWYFCGKFCLSARNANSQFWLLWNFKASGQSIGSSSWLQARPQRDGCWLFLLRAVVCNIIWQ